MDILGQIETFIKEIDTAQNVEEVTLALRKQIDRLGFERFSYQLLRSPEGPRPKFYISGYPKDWTARYIEKHHVSNDMVSSHAARVVRPFSWLEIGRFHDFTEEQKLVFNEASEFDIKIGGTVPIHGPGLAKALFTVTANLSNDEFTKYFNERRHEVHLIGTYMHEKLLALGLPEPPILDMKLTPREIEMLLWTARGKTRSDIADILKMAEETVKQHTESACRKLRASNKTHAVAVALIHGLITP